MHELAATSLAGLTLVMGTWVTQDQLERRFVQLHRSDAERVGQLMQEHLMDARQQLDSFAVLSAQQQKKGIAMLLPAFSDVYQLDQQQRVANVLKANFRSRVFRGFSFSGSHIDEYLKDPVLRASSSSVIERGIEDDRASVYFTTAGQAGDRMLARIDLSYLQDFLQRYKKASGLPVLLVNRHGFVMLSSDPELHVPAVDVGFSASLSARPDLIQYDNRSWLPLVGKNQGLGGHIVTLIPTDQMEQQRLLVWLPSLVVTLLALVVFAWKNRRLHQQLFGPVTEFTSLMERVRSDMADPQLEPLTASPAVSRFTEMRQIQAGLEELLEAIRERDQSLQQKLRTSLTAAAIAHEINLPLSTIRLRCQQADQQLSQGVLTTEQSRALVQELQAESQQVSRVIERMRMLLRNVQTELLPTDLAAIVVSSLTLHKRQLREQDVQVERQGLDGQLLIVMADAVQLQMAVSNLLRNAIEAVAQQPPDHRRLLVKLRRAGDRAELVIADSGPGFSFDAATDTLFRSTKASGSGLGLFVVRTTLNNHHGSLQIGRSLQLGGAELCVGLPLARQRPENYSKIPMVPAVHNP
jgi:C4-dicarboxylate-specific signal transduction histidine kinase